MQSSAKSLYAQLPGFLREHPGLGLTLAYVVMSGVGMAFKFALFARFGINVFDLADLNDFLIAGLRHPETFGFSLLSGLILWGAIRLQKQQSHARPWVVDALHTFVVLGWFSVFIVLYSAYLAQQIRLGKGEEMVLTSPGITSERVSLVGTTGRYVVVYRASLSKPETAVVPTEQVELMRFDLPETVVIRP